MTAFEERQSTLVAVAGAMASPKVGFAIGTKPVLQAENIQCVETNHKAKGNGQPQRFVVSYSTDG